MLCKNVAGNKEYRVVCVVNVPRYPNHIKAHQYLFGYSAKNGDDVNVEWPLRFSKTILPKPSLLFFWTPRLPAAHCLGTMCYELQASAKRSTVQLPQAVWSVLGVPERHIIRVRHIWSHIPGLCLPHHCGRHWECLHLIFLHVPSHEIVHRHIHRKELNQGLCTLGPNDVAHCRPKIMWLHQGLPQALPATTVLAREPQSTGVLGKFLGQGGLSLLALKEMLLHLIVLEFISMLPNQQFPFDFILE